MKADEIVAEIEKLLPDVTAGPWRHATYMSGTQNVEYPGARGITFVDQVLAADASRICYESDAQPFPFINVDHRPEDKNKEADPQRSINAAWIALLNPANVRTLLADLAKAQERIAGLEKALEWYANLPKEWTIKAGSGLAYGDLHLLGEKARAALEAKP